MKFAAITRRFDFEIHNVCTIFQDVEVLCSFVQTTGMILQRLGHSAGDEPTTDPNVMVVAARIRLLSCKSVSRRLSSENATRSFQRW